MFRVPPPMPGINLTPPPSIASASGPLDAALAISQDVSSRPSQLHGELEQIRRIRSELAARVSKPAEPGWNDAMANVVGTEKRIQSVLTHLQALTQLPAHPGEGTNVLAPLATVPAQRPSDRTSEALPSEAESPMVPFHDRPEAHAQAHDSAALESVIDGQIRSADLPPLFKDLGPGGAAQNSTLIEFEESTRSATRSLSELATKAYDQLKRSQESTGSIVLRPYTGVTGELEAPPEPRPSPERVAAPDMRQQQKEAAEEAPIKQEQRSKLREIEQEDTVRRSRDALEQLRTIALKQGGLYDEVSVASPISATVDLLS